MSAIHAAETEVVPALPDFFNDITAKRIAIPRQSQALPVISSGRQRETLRSVQEPDFPVLSVTPVAVWVTVIAVYAGIAWVIFGHVNAVVMAVAVLSGH